MALRTFRPTSPGLRHLVLVDRSGLWKGGPVKMLTEGKTKSGGRNNDGRITTPTSAAGTSSPTGSSTRRKHDVPAVWNGSSTTRTAPPSSPSSSTRTASSPTSWRRSGSPPATASWRAPRST